MARPHPINLETPPDKHLSMTRFLFWTGILISFSLFFVVLIPIAIIVSLGWLGIMIAILIGGS